MTLCLGHKLQTLLPGVFLLAEPFQHGLDLSLAIVGRRRREELRHQRLQRQQIRVRHLDRSLNLGTLFSRWACQIAATPLCSGNRRRGRGCTYDFLVHQLTSLMTSRLRDFKSFCSAQTFTFWIRFWCFRYYFRSFGICHDPSLL